MTLAKFIVGMTFVIVVVTIWSLFDSASFGLIVLRVIVCAVLLQVGYFLAVLGMVALNRPRGVAGAQAGKPGEKKTKGSAAADNLTSGRPLT